jgi:superfamily II DNA or RNA helicase
VVVGTTLFFGEGFDVPALDTLFLAGPFSFDRLLVQCAGRVVRSLRGKEVAEVYDYHDVATPIRPRRCDAACPATGSSASKWPANKGIEGLCAVRLGAIRRWPPVRFLCS